MAKQQEQLADRLRQYDDKSRRALARAEREFLMEKQTLMKARATALWDMEERQLHDKHQTVKQQIREQYLLQRQQLLVRHDKELEQVDRQNLRSVEEIEMRQKTEHFKLPKQQRKEEQTRLIMFKQALKVQNITGDAERIRLRDFNLQEDRRLKTQIERLEKKHAEQRRELEENNINNIREVRQLQNEKRRLLIDRENERLNSIENSFRQDLHKWRQKILPQRTMIDQQFAEQLEQLERFVAAGKRDHDREGIIHRHQVQENHPGFFNAAGHMIVSPIGQKSFEQHHAQYHNHDHHLGRRDIENEIGNDAVDDNQLNRVVSHPISQRSEEIGEELNRMQSRSKNSNFSIDEAGIPPGSPDAYSTDLYRNMTKSKESNGSAHHELTAAPSMSVIDNDMIEDVANMQINEEELPRIESMPNFEDEDQSTIVNN